MNQIKIITIILSLFLIQYLNHSYEWLLVLSFLLGSLINFEKRTLFIYMLAELSVIIILILIQGLNFTVLNQFAEIFAGIPAWLLLSASLLISVLSISLPAWLAYDLRHGFFQRKAP